MSEGIETEEKGLEMRACSAFSTVKVSCLVSPVLLPTIIETIAICPQSTISSPLITIVGSDELVEILLMPREKNSLWGSTDMIIRKLVNYFALE